MLQIIVGAALTALGAAKGPPAAVTYLGAVNTVVAGLLTYLKGQGLPMHLKQYLHLLRTLREHIEAREREILEPECPLDVDEEIEPMTKMYQEVRQTAQDNAPGTVLPPRGAITSLIKKPDINRSDVSGPRGDKTAGEVFKTVLQNLATLRDHASDSTAEKGEAHLGNAKEGMKGAENKMERLGGMAKDTINRLSGEYLHERHPREKTTSMVVVTRESAIRKLSGRPGGSDDAEFFGAHFFANQSEKSQALEDSRATFVVPNFCAWSNSLPEKHTFANTI